MFTSPPAVTPLPRALSLLWAWLLWLRLDPRLTLMPMPPALLAALPSTGLLEVDGGVGQGHRFHAV